MAALTEEQSMIRDQAKSWVTEQAPVQKFRQLRDSGSEDAFAPDIWSSMVDMGGQASSCRNSSVVRILVT